jgi:hypothetical protein
MTPALTRSARRCAVLLAALLALAVLVAPSGAGASPLAGAVPLGDVLADDDEGPPLPEPAFLHPSVPAGECTVENEYEAAIYGLEVGDVRYPGVCKRLSFAFGPIVVKPGENDALLEPVTIEKPAYDGYVVRFKPDMRRAIDGSAPNTEDMHLHHATWLSAYPQYGNGLPFFAAGEEKTIATFPEGYGMPVGGQDAWLLLYMVHNDRADTDVVWLTWDLDYIAADAVDELDVELAEIRPVWLDVQRTQIHPDAPSTSANPVFNVQRGFGHIDEETGRLVCAWPRENCARHDTYGQVTPQQGQTEEADGTPIEIPGADWRVPAGFAGNLIGLGGHLHFGGIRTELSQVRDGVEKPIMLSDALYWHWEDRDQDKIGAHPWSWDFSMTVTGAPDWKVRIKEGDILRLNAIVDSDDASWYEGMGIVVAYVAPDDPHLPEPIDVFDDDVIIDRGYPARALIPEGPWDVKEGFTPEPCTPDFTGELNDGRKRLCLRGMPTHGPLDESGNHTPPCPEEGCPPITEELGQETTDIFSVAFTYGQAELGAVNALGLPVLRKGQPARLWNFDTAARIWHTFTRCAYPCTGQKNMWYPAADGGSGDPDDVMDFDSNEIGFGTPFEPASGQLPPSGTGKSWPQTVQDSLYYEFTPTEEGVYTFFCRIHRGMRGAFAVVE